MTVILFFFFLSLLIFIHELGHFLIAKKLGAKVEEFSLGFPPRIFSKKFNETTYSLGLFLFGGYVKLRGENDPTDKEGFLYLPSWKKLFIIISGVCFNIFLGYLLFTLSLNLGYPFKSDKIFVTGFLSKNTQAFNYFQIGDQILKIRVDSFDYYFENLEELSDFLKEHQGKEVEIFYLREKNVYSVKVVPPVGFYLGNFTLKKVPFSKSIYLGLIETVKNLKKIVWSFKEAILSLFIPGKKISLEIVGPIGIYNLFDNFKNFGLGYLFYFVGMLSLNLAIINILPFPALDGGRVLFVLIEIVKGKRIDYNKEEIVHKIGFVFLLFLLVLVTLKDISKLWIK